MKLFYYDKFLESYSNLPKGIQKKVQDFVQKFRKDSTMRSIHLEPISTFKDPQLRTARIDQKYRAIIHSSATGDIFHILWVDNHDESMAWAANKVFEWNKNTQTYQVYEHQESVTAPVEEKLAKAKESYCGKYADEELLSIGIPYPLLPSVKTIDSLGDLEKMEAYLPREAFESIYYLLDGLSIEEIMSEIEDGKEASDEFVNQLNSANNQRSFFEITDDQYVEEFLQGDLSKWKIFLHPTQRTMVENHYKGSFKLTGAAGTGKTVVALHRLKFLAQLSNTSKSILFTTFTKSLVKNLKDSIRELNITTDKVVRNNIHNFIVEKARELKLIEEDSKIIDFLNKEKKEELWKEVIEFKLSEFDVDFLMREYEDVILFNNIAVLEEYLKVSRVGLEVPLGRKDRKKVWEIFDYFEKIKNQNRIYYLDEITNKLTTYFIQQSQKPFEFIVADEIQDFSDVELRLLRAMVGEKENDLFLVGDPLQKIYKRNINFSRCGINIKGKRSKRLKVNYRTTEEIKRSAVSVIKNISFDDFDGSDEQKQGYISILRGEKPEYKIFKSSEDMNRELLNLIEIIRDNNVLNLNEVCIATRIKQSLNEAKKKLHVSHILYYDLTNQSGDKNGIILSTFHNIKGLEFKIVILYDVCDTTVPNKYFGYESLTEYEKNAYDKSEKALLYVAMSRAIKRLFILGVGKKTNLIQL